MRTLFVPNQSGDYRLERDPSGPETRCVLTVVDPTRADKERLIPFIELMRERKMIEAGLGFQPVGKSVIPISGPLEVCGPLMAEKTLGDGEIWVAVRSVDGMVSIEDGGAQAQAIAEIAKKEEVVAAVAVKPPLVGCPAPAPCNRRASQVLTAFSTRRQIESWKKHGFMSAIGGATGNLYHVYHRDAAAKKGLDHALVDVTRGGRTICVWDERLPAEEEALVLKLTVENAGKERWLLGLGMPRAKRARGRRVRHEVRHLENGVLVDG